MARRLEAVAARARPADLRDRGRLPTDGGVIGRWFGQPGGGVMYRLESTGNDIAWLVEQGVLATI
jgi:hypothetical protein